MTWARSDVMRIWKVLQFFKFTKKCRFRKIMVNLHSLFSIGEKDKIQLCQCTVWLKSQTDCPILYCKRPIWRVGVWPKWVGPAHSTLGQSTPYTSRLTYSKMNHFCPVVLKWHTFVFLSSQLWLILLLSGWRVKYKCVPFLNYWTKIAHFLIPYHWSVYNWLTKWAVGGANPYGPHPYPPLGSFTV